MLSIVQKVIKITRNYIYTIQFDQTASNGRFKFDRYFDTDFLHLDKWYRFYYEIVKIKKKDYQVLQYAVFVDKDKRILLTDYQKRIDSERKELKVSAKEWRMERDYIKSLLEKFGEI